MYAVIYTVRTDDNAGRANYAEDWDLHDTLEEARARANRLVNQWDMRLVAYHIAEILESTQPELVAKKEIWGTDK
jgi:2',3'-cyclic-nucleotide 2'-phosphodiesterase (5'-nucleotidase family)